MQKSLATMVGGSQLDDWDLETFIEWLNTNKLHEFIPLFSGEEITASDQGYLPMFQRVKDKNQIVLSKCNIAKLLEFIFLPEDDPLTKLWDRKFFVRDLILTHQAFMKSQQLFKFLSLKCCSTGSTTSIVLLTRDFIQSLVKYLKFDLRVNEIWCNMITQLANAIGKVNADVSKDIMRYLDLALTVRPPKVIDINVNENALETTLQNFLDREYDILALQHYTLEFATQLTLIEQKYAHCTEIREFLNQAWTNDKISTPNLDRYIEFTNRVSGFITRDILSQPMSKLQAEAINYYTDVANQLFKLNNFNGLQMVLACLHSPALAKIKTAWNLVAKKTKEDFDRLTDLMSPQNHYRAYEECVNAIDENEIPVIPFVSVPLRDLFMAEEALHTVVAYPRGWVNFDKMTKLGKIIWSFRKFQLRYNYSPIPIIQNYIEEKAEIWDNKVAYEIAKLREENNELEWNVLPAKPTTGYYGEELDMYNSESLSISEFQSLLPSSSTDKPQTYKHGTEIIRRGDNFSRIFYVESGSLTIDGISDSTERFTIGTIGKNQLIGLESLLQPTFISTVWIQVQDEVRLREVSRRLLINLFNTDPDLFAKFSKILAGRLAQLVKNKRAKAKANKTGTPNSKLTKTNQNPVTAKLKKKKGKTIALSNKLKYKKPIFEDTFELKGEIAIKEYVCQMKKGSSLMINGILFVSQNNLCFANYSVNFVRLKHRCIVPLKSIVSIQKQGKSLIVASENAERKNEKEEMEFANFDNLEEVTEFLSSYWHRKLQNKPHPQDDTDPTSWSLTQSDWEKIISASKELTFHNQQVVKPPGYPHRALYRIVGGSCQVINKNQQVVGEMAQGDMFGVLEFILNSPSYTNYEVKAVEDNTKVHRIEGYYLDVLFSYDPRLCGRFYNYLSSELTAKLQALYYTQMEKQMEGVLNLLEASAGYT